MRCVGYRQTWEAQEGIIPHKELRDRGIFATRQLAKRQITWLTNSFAAENLRLPRPRAGRQGRDARRRLSRRLNRRSAGADAAAAFSR